MAGEPLTPERLAELRYWAEKARRRGSCSFVPLSPRQLLALLDTIDARDAVMRRYRLGWVESDVQRGYWVDSAGGWIPVPMTDAEQLVVYGRLVSGQEKDTNADVSEAGDA